MTDAITKAVGVLNAFGDDAPIRNRREFADSAIAALTALQEQPAPVGVKVGPMGGGDVIALVEPEDYLPSLSPQAAYANGWNAALSALQPSPAPVGVKLVPVEPTTEMLDAYWKQTGESKEMRPRTHAYMKRYWSVMLDAAPSALQPSPAREDRPCLHPRRTG